MIAADDTTTVVVDEKNVAAGVDALRFCCEGCCVCWCVWLKLYEDVEPPDDDETVSCCCGLVSVDCESAFDLERRKRGRNPLTG